MTETISARITAQVREIREAQGVTRDELATAARSAGAPDGFTTAALRNVEIGRRAVTVDELVALAAALKVPVRQLLDEYADLFGAEVEKPVWGAVQAAAREAVQGLPDLDGHQLALAQSAFALAQSLDAGAGMAAAAIAKELRATLKDIWDGVAVDDDEEDDYGPS